MSKMRPLVKNGLTKSECKLFTLAEQRCLDRLQQEKAMEEERAEAQGAAGEKKEKKDKKSKSDLDSNTPKGQQERRKRKKTRNPSLIWTEIRCFVCQRLQNYWKMQSVRTLQMTERKRSSRFTRLVSCLYVCRKKSNSMEEGRITEVRGIFYFLYQNIYVCKHIYTVCQKMRLLAKNGLTKSECKLFTLAEQRCLDRLQQEKAMEEERAEAQGAAGEKKRKKTRIQV
ncbi:uncharacterized protein LOC120354892 isoform X2 [Nilaparvata lugens]|uniref:uncharacterized protein LOC120354892 isoform X1 n=1 Tax=Nilaparvata lugens TaxID=108931 RepID=UPI00193E2155|nr:uncharacterized protein LOC120354892 isoform X1 [Nilaparvata lugens]XP_039298894.1 uncharacterized protein LOC120354892 isoform X2 [Nilaparvata lugens]